MRFDLEQWHLKSVSDEQPSDWSGPRKQLRAHCGRLESWAYEPAAKRAARVKEAFMVTVYVVVKREA